MREIKFRVKGNLFPATVPENVAEFDEKFGEGSCIEAATKELIRDFQVSLRTLYGKKENPTDEEVNQAIAETTPAKRQAVGAGGGKISKSKKVRAIADAVKNGDLEEAKRLFKEMGFGDEG